MGLLDVLLLAAIGGGVWLALWALRRGKSGGCHGGCGNCPHACGRKQ